MEFKMKQESSWSAAQLGRNRRSHVQDKEAGRDQPLQMYLLPPTGDVTLEEFDALAAERLQVLRTFERAGHVGKHKFTTEWEDFILAELKRQKLNTYHQLLSGRGDSAVSSASAEAARRDHVSHFILRLAYCRTEELRSWFVQHEIDLFRMRFQAQKKMDPKIGNFLADNGIHLHEVPEEDRDRLGAELLSGTARMTQATLELTQWYTVPFTEALELVRGRRVLLQAGHAFIPARDLGTIVAAKFRAHLQHALAMSRRLLPVVEEDSRLKAMLNDFDKRYTGRDYSAAKNDENAVTPDMLDDLSSQSFPPCMRELHERLRASHKLFHGGRMQYGLFLKAIGLSLDNAIAFWREEFTKVMDNDKFHKQYLYNIRHNYGQEGKRTNYSAHPCSKILAAGSNDSGCPFKHYDRDHLGKMLSAHGVDKDGCAEIFELTGRSQPQMACQKYWELVHRTPFEGAMQHPNQYYEESRKTFTGHRVKTDRGLDRSRVIRASLPAKAASASTSATQSEWDDDDDVEMSEEMLQSMEATG